MHGTTVMRPWRLERAHRSAFSGREEYREESRARQGRVRRQVSTVPPCAATKVTRGSANTSMRGARRRPFTSTTRGGHPTQPHHALTRATTPRHATSPCNECRLSLPFHGGLRAQPPSLPLPRCPAPPVSRAAMFIDIRLPPNEWCRRSIHFVMLAGTGDMHAP